MAVMLRIATYNVHSFIGTDRHHDPMRTARVLRESGARILALQEVRWSRRDAPAHTLQRLADTLGMGFAFQRTAAFAGEEFGLAILSDLPMRRMAGGPLPRLGPNLPERRSALHVDIETPAGPLAVFCTHLAVLSARDRMVQAQALLGPEWIGGTRLPAVLAGDLNAGIGSPAYKRLAASLACARAQLATREATFPSRWPLTRIDHLMGANGARLEGAGALRTPTTRLASDHLPFVADVLLPAVGDRVEDTAAEDTAAEDTAADVRLTAASRR